MTLSDIEKFKLEIKAGEVFTPAAPVVSAELFSGRKEQIRKVIDTINQVGQHCIVYGERGVGKTSLAYVLDSFIPESNPDIPIFSIRVSCDSEDNFDSVWEKVFKELPISQKTLTIPVSGLSSQQNLPFSNNAFFQDSSEIVYPITPDLIRETLTKVGKEYKLYIIIDEFDRLLDERIELFSDTIKNLSDRLAPVTLILIGVAESVIDLVAAHSSIERAIRQVQMPRMTSSEIKEIIKRGLNALGLSYSDEALSCIVTISKGLPHYAHLLGLYASRSCIQTDGSTVEVKSVENAIVESLEHNQTIKNDYYNATTSSRETNYPHALLACAMANSDEQGFFTQKNAATCFSELTGRTIQVANIANNINNFCKEDRGEVLERRGIKKRYKYRFKNPMMQPYVILRGLESQMINTSKLI